MDKRTNIVLCGRTGDGKSSIANMLIQGDIYLDKQNVFEIGNDARGQTMDINYAYDGTHGVFDLIGLGELTSGSVSHDEAIKTMRNHFSNFSEKLNYICYVKRSRNTLEDVKMFNVFKNIFKEGEKNFVIIVTHSKPSWANNEKNVDAIKKDFGDYPIVSVDFPCKECEDYIEIDRKTRLDSLQHLLEKLSKLNYEGINLEILSSFQNAENVFSKVINFVPVVGSLYQLTASGVYHKLGKPKLAKKRFQDGASGIVLDVVSFGSLGTGKTVIKIVKIGVKAVAKKVGADVGVNVSVRAGAKICNEIIEWLKKS